MELIRRRLKDNKKQHIADTIKLFYAKMLKPL
jgi:hypothetical protein